MTTKQIQQELQVAEGSNTIFLMTIYRWIKAFEMGKGSVEDNSRAVQAIQKQNDV